ncbi:MAG: NlpC/P60 family protein [Armatimonadetes bacterium]|nr:NlpC/P60 family protein [Armatimonadota bacterium]
MHAQPSGDSEQVSQTVLGHTVLVQDVPAATEGWLQAQTDDGYTGWVRARQVRLLDEGEEYPQTGAVYRVNALWAMVREQPDVQSLHLTIAPLGAWLEGQEWQGDWLRVRLPDGRDGWVEAQEVTSQWVMVTRVGKLRVEGIVVSQGRNAEPYAVPRTGWQNALVYTARRLLSVPYLWGGSSPFGLDCSGFVQLVYRLCGIVIPRDANLQAEWERTTEVPLADVQPGDLIFFATGDDPHRRTITHVGMTFDRQYFIHSAGGVGVHLSALEDPYYRSVLWGIRRVIDEVKSP